MEYEKDTIHNFFEFIVTLITPISQKKKKLHRHKVHM